MTPGPWTLIDEPRNKHYRDRVRGVDYEATMQHCWYIAGPLHDSHFVADVITSLNRDGRQNARLMATSPELLESLEELVAHLDKYDPLSHEPIEDHDCVLCRARRRIANAKSEEPRR